jgi:hypothetical protein
VSFEDGFLEGADGASPRFIQRIAAVRPVLHSHGLNPGDSSPAAAAPHRYSLLASR